jgi:serine/threonine-protein kinase RsbW
MKDPSPRTVKLEIASRFEMLEMVQTVLSHLSGLLGFDEDASHYMSVAVRESVVNAIKHGNRLDESKRVELDFVLGRESLEVRVRDEGRGFDPDGVPNPIAEENLLKPEGRGIFFMRSFMDEVSYSFPARGGTVVRMVKRLPLPAGVEERS